MDILVSTLCDFAADYQGKLCIQGGFDSLVARQFPVVHPVCAVALRICLTPEDEGNHELGPVSYTHLTLPTILLV